MKKFHHPAVLPLYAAFVTGKELWFVTPFMVRRHDTTMRIAPACYLNSAWRQIDQHAVP